MRLANTREAITLRHVRNWCLSNGVSRHSFLKLYREAHLICISRILHYVLLERLCEPCIAVEESTEGTVIWIGLDTKLEVRIAGHAPKLFFELLGAPDIWLGKTHRRILFAGAFLRVLRQVLSSTPYADDFLALELDYRNSFFNLVLNLALGGKHAKSCTVVEPAYRGHAYYPFPALRIGPSVQDVVDVSHLSPRPVSLFFVEAGGYRFHSTDYSGPEACAADWAGVALARQPFILPIHPWQLRLSAVVKDMLNNKLIGMSPVVLDMMPLVSQRTCRILATGHDIKLPLDVTLTGEHRLLYRLNSHNAPFVSTIIREVRRLSGMECIDFQYDVASMCWDDALVNSHLSCIVRAPCLSVADEVVVPVLNVWASVEKASALLDIDSRPHVLELFDEYCRVVMCGPLLLCAQWGICLEPHMQNVYIVLRGGKPVRVILRDLDNAIMDPRPIVPLCRQHGIPLAEDTWDHMPDFSIGQLRLIHAMFHGHLYQVMHFLLKHTGVGFCELDHCINDNWRRVVEQVQTPAARKSLETMRTLVGTTKHSLSMRLKRSTSMLF